MNETKDGGNYETIGRLIDEGNDLFLKSSDQQGILSTALIAALGLVGYSVANHLSIASAACLALAAALSAGVHLGLGAWKIGAAKRMFIGKTNHARE